MPKLFRRTGETVALAEDPFVSLQDDDPTPEVADGAGVIVSFARFQAIGESLLGEGRRVGVRLAPDQQVESLTYDLPRISVVALEFPKFRDGRAFTAATLLRERFGYTGEVRAVGEVLREQAQFMARCGFDAFEPSDASTPEQFAQAAAGFRHVYQAAADGRPPAFAERSAPDPTEES